MIAIPQKCKPPLDRSHIKNSLVPYNVDKSSLALFNMSNTYKDISLCDWFVILPFLKILVSGQSRQDLGHSFLTCDIFTQASIVQCWAHHGAWSSHTLAENEVRVNSSFEYFYSLPTAWNFCSTPNRGVLDPEFLWKKSALSQNPVQYRRFSRTRIFHVVIPSTMTASLL